MNTELVQICYKMGKYIVEFEQNGAKKQNTKKGLLEQLSRDLSIKYGKGFSFVWRQYKTTLNNNHYTNDLINFIEKQMRVNK